MFSDIMFEHPAVTGDKTSSLSEKLMRSKVIIIGTYELQISTECLCAILRNADSTIIDAP